MKIPRRLKIGESDYAVCVIRELDESVSGLCEIDAKVIIIRPDQSASELHATFWHEVLHAIEKEYGMNLGHKKIGKLEYALAQVYSQLVRK